MKRSGVWCRAVLFGAVLLSCGAHADETPAGTLSGSITVASDYLFRGISQTDRRPAAQLGVEYDRASGWYLGGWASNVSWLSDTSTSAQPVSNSLEFDAYAGWRGQFDADWRWDAGLYAYTYPGSYPHGYTRPQTVEGYVWLGWKTLTLKVFRSFTNLFGTADSHGSDYLELSWHQPLSPDWMLEAHVGRQQVAHHGSASYDDWKLGVTRTFGQGWSLALEWHDTDARRAVYTNAQGKYLGRATAVLSVAKAF